MPYIPQSFKSACVTPVLTKAGLDNSDLENYRPISNLVVISTLLVRVILRRLLEHLKSNGLLPSAQSTYQKCRSTETALAKVLSDILMALDQGNVAELAAWLSDLWLTCDHFVGKASAMGQPTRPTQLPTLSGTGMCSISVARWMCVTL